MQVYQNTTTTLPWMRLALAAVVIGTLLAAATTQARGGMFAGSGELPKVAFVLPGVTPVAEAPAVVAAIPVGAAGTPGQTTAMPGLAAYVARWQHAESAEDAIERHSIPESPFRWQGVAGAAPRRTLTLGELDAAAAKAGWPRIEGWWPEMRRIITEYECPSLSTHCFNAEDPNGGSYGLTQLNGVHHFEQCGEDFHMRYDPVVNLRTALCLRAALGRFGGAGGWAGADILKIK